MAIIQIVKQSTHAVTTTTVDVYQITGMLWEWETTTTVTIDKHIAIIEAQAASKQAAVDKIALTIAQHFRLAHHIELIVRVITY